MSAQTTQSGPTIDRKTIQSLIPQALGETNFPDLGKRLPGKVRDCYVKGDIRTLIATDRISAFDVILGTVPLKGQVLNAMSVYWFEATKHLVPNHLIDVPDPCVSVGLECRPLPAEMVMRGYLTGSSATSIWRAYERGERTFCGHPLPDGMKKHQKLEKPLLTPSTKAEIGEHDRSVSRRELLAMGLISSAQFDEMADYAHRLFAFGQQQAAQNGLILVDTKYEFGLDPKGRIVLIDEIHTPDSSRYWYADDYAERFAAGQDPRSLDKEFIRRHLRENMGYSGDGPPPALPADIIAEGALRYLDIYRQVTGQALQPDLSPPLARIRKNLGLN
jgi:phosphoribosylaminoimidazole-succinocarboxamide synthase